MTRLGLLLLLLPAVLLGAACGDLPPAPPPDPALVSLYCDLAQVAGEIDEAAPDSLRQAIFARHGTTPEAFRQALSPYQEDPRGWIDFFRAVVDTLDQRLR